MQFAGRLPPEEFWAQIDSGDDEVRRTFHERPAYGVSGWLGRPILGEWAFGEGVRSIAFLPDGWEGADWTASDARPRVIVHVDTVPPREVVRNLLARDLFASGGQPWPFPDVPMPHQIVEVVIDGVAEPFEAWALEDDGWRAAGRVGAVTVVVETVGVPLGEIALARVGDIEPLLDERRRWIREVRGGE